MGPQGLLLTGGVWNQPRVSPQGRALRLQQLCITAAQACGASSLTGCCIFPGLNKVQRPCKPKASHTGGCLPIIKAGAAVKSTSPCLRDLRVSSCLPAAVVAERSKQLPQSRQHSLGQPPSLIL